MYPRSNFRGRNRVRLCGSRHRRQKKLCVAFSRGACAVRARTCRLVFVLMRVNARTCRLVFVLMRVNECVCLLNVCVYLLNVCVYVQEFEAKIHTFFSGKGADAQ